MRQKNPSPLNIVLEILARTARQRKKLKANKQEGSLLFLCTEKSKVLTKKWLEARTFSSKFIDEKRSIQKSVGFLYSNRNIITRKVYQQSYPQ